MAINLKLSTRVNEDPALTPWGRSWYGWDPHEPFEAIWENNRGCWNVGARADEERFATMSFEGTVRLVAEIHGRSEVFYNGGSKPCLALEGRLLPEGHPVREALLGREVDHHRNPVTYFDSADLEADHPRLEPDDRYFVATLSDLALTLEQTQALWDVTGRGGEYLASLGGTADEFEELRPDDVVIIVDDTVADTPIVAVGHAIKPEHTNPSQTSDSTRLKIAIEAVVGAADALILVDPETEEPSPLRINAGPIDRELGEEALHLWHAHLIEVGWWGDLGETLDLMDRYAKHFGSSEDPAPLAVAEGSSVDSEASFLALAGTQGGPEVLAMARTYAHRMGLGPGQFSISALPQTGRNSSYRRALTLSVGGTEALWIGVDPATGQVLDWGVRVTPTYADHQRWINLEVAPTGHGHYAVGGGSLPFLRLFSEDFDVKAMRQAAMELTTQTKAAQRKGWHNPYLETAILEPPTA